MKLLEQLNEYHIQINGKRQRLYKFLCEYCHSEVIRPRIHGLMVKSCGCYRNRMMGTDNPAYKHGCAKTKLYRIWSGIFSRCDPHTKHTGNRRWYSEKGIKVCEEWQDFTKFNKWARFKYKPGLQIDRIDNNGNYEPNNCRFVTCKKNINNSSRVLKVKAKLPEVQKAIDSGWTNGRISKQLGISWCAINDYLRKGELNDKPRKHELYGGFEGVAAERKLKQQNKLEKEKQVTGKGLI